MLSARMLLSQVSSSTRRTRARELVDRPVGRYGVASKTVRSSAAAAAASSALARH
ncbi:hypothetical protein O1M63_10210 [Streptomyces mirabilis]|nr:hypothetical protein [Streptomyces mirabilis]